MTTGLVPEQVLFETKGLLLAVVNQTSKLLVVYRPVVPAIKTISTCYILLDGVPT